MIGRNFLPLALVLVLSSDARADKFAAGSPQPTLFASEYGMYAFKILPDASSVTTRTRTEGVHSAAQVGQIVGNSEGVFFRLDENAKENVIWRAKLVNIPNRAILVESGKYVITLDSWHSIGFDHCLVVYGEKGKVIANFKLEDLLTAKEIEGLPSSITHRGWSDKDIAEFEDRSREDELVIRMKYKDWTKVIHLSLSSGRIVYALAVEQKPPVVTARAIIAPLDRLAALGARISVVGGVVQDVDLTDSTITDRDMELIGSLTSLERLILNGCANLTDNGLAQLKGLTRLKALFLERTRITDAGLANLSGLTELNHLSLNWTKTGDAGLKRLEGLTNLEVLYLCATDTADDGLASIAKMRKLQWLDLRQTKVQDAGLAHLRNMPQLRLLCLYGIRMTDAGVPALTELPHLEGLTLSHTQVTDAGLEPLTRLSKLKELDLNGTQVTQAGADRLQKLLRGCQVRYRASPTKIVEIE